MSFKDTIKIQDFSVDCIIGILPYEREVKQKVFIDIDLFLDLSLAAEAGKIERTVDYALVTRQVQFIMETCNFELLETAAMAIVAWLASPVPTAHSFSVDAAEVRIKKPKALEGNGVPQVCIKRFCRDLKVETKQTNSVTQDILFHSDRVAIIRVYHFGSTEIPPSPSPYVNYKDFNSNSRDLLRVAWK
jgi:FolB domain-containing protein